MLPSPNHLIQNPHAPILCSLWSFPTADTHASRHLVSAKERFSRRPSLSQLPDDVLTNIFHILFSSFYLGYSLSSLCAVRSWTQVNRQFYNVYRQYFSRVLFRYEPNPLISRYRRLDQNCPGPQGKLSQNLPFTPFSIQSLVCGDAYVTNALRLIHSRTRNLVVSKIDTDQIFGFLKAARDVKAHIRSLCMCDTEKNQTTSTRSRYARTVSTIRTLRALCVSSPTSDLLSRMRRPSFPTTLRHLALHGLSIPAYSALIDYLYDRPHNLESLSVETGVSSPYAPVEAMYLPCQPSVTSSVPGTVLLHDTALHLLLEYSISSIKLRYTSSAQIGSAHVVPPYANDDIEVNYGNISYNVSCEDEEGTCNMEQSHCYCSLCSESVTAHLAHIDNGIHFIEHGMRRVGSPNLFIVHGEIHGRVYSSFGTLSSGLIPQNHPNICVFASCARYRKHFLVSAFHNPNLNSNLPLAAVSNTRTVTADTSEMSMTFRLTPRLELHGQYCQYQQQTQSYKPFARFQVYDFKSVCMVRFQPIQEGLQDNSCFFQPKVRAQTKRTVGNPNDLIAVENMFRLAPMAVTFLRITAFDPRATFGLQNLSAVLSSVSQCPRLAVLDIPLSTVIALLDQNRFAYMLTAVPLLRLLHLRGLPYDGRCTHPGRERPNVFGPSKKNPYCGDACNRMLNGLSKLPQLVHFLANRSPHLARLDWHVEPRTIGRIQQWCCVCPLVRAANSLDELVALRGVEVTSVRTILKHCYDRVTKCPGVTHSNSCNLPMKPSWTY